MNTRRAQSARLGRALLAAAALASLLLLISCGGGGGASSTPTSKPPPAPLTITTEVLAEGMTGQHYSSQLSATGGTPPYRWSLASGSDALPSGLALDTAGFLSGTPTAAGDFDLTVQVQDHASRSATKTLALKIIAPLQVTTTSLPAGMVGQPYSQTLHATGGSPPYTWTLAAGSLQAGLTLRADGVVSGTPTEGDARSVDVQVQDASSRTASQWLNLTIVQLLDISVFSLPSLPSTNVWASYLAGVQVSGGVPPYDLSLAPGSAPLPPGITFTGYPTGWGQFQGTPTAPGTYGFTLRAEDSGTIVQTVTRGFTILVENNLNIPEYAVMPYGVIHQPYLETVGGGGGTPPYSWSIVSGSLPTGLILSSSTGELSGVPTWSGRAEFGVRLTDSATPPQSVEGTVSLFIRPELQFRDATLPDAVHNATYTAEIYVDGGRPPITLEYTGGTFPPGISQTSQDPSVAVFNLGGTPTELGTFPFSVRVTDSSSPPTVLTRDFSIRVNELLRLATSSLPEGFTDAPYTATLTATGGVLPYRWGALQQFTLPSGLSLDPTAGIISGTPTQPTNLLVWVNLLDSSSPAQGAYDNLWLRIIERLAVSTSTIPPSKPDQPIAIALAARGGTPPYAWAIISGSLPSGLTLDSATGNITGTPTTEGTSNFTVQVTDVGPPVQTASRALSLTITNSPGRNDSPATATPISNGTFRASISPYSDPVDGPAFSDNDYYALTANPGAIVTLETMADRLTPPSPLDSVIEVVDADGNRFTTCRPGNDDYGAFNRDCLNDDFDWYNTLDSKLQFQVPGAGTNPVTFYVHVLDWRGSARPDFVYDLIVSGAN
jgi:hypothetical protein